MKLLRDPPTDLALAFVLGLALIVAVAWSATRSFDRMQETTTLMTRSHDARTVLNVLQSLILDVDAGARGFALTGDPQSLEPFEDAVAALNDNLRALCAITSDSARQQADCDRLAPLVAMRISLAWTLVETRRTAGLEAASQVVLSGRGDSVMDEIHTIVMRMDAEEQLHLGDQFEAVRFEATATERLALVGGVLALTLLGVGVTLLMRENRRRQKVEGELFLTVSEQRAFKTALDEHATVLVTDLRGIITTVNDKYCDISKYPREALVGKDCRLVNSGHHPKAFMEALWSTIQSGRTWHGEIRNRAADGSHYWVSTTIVPFLDQRGAPVKYVAIGTDITGRKQSEDALKQQEQWLHLALDSGDMGAWELDVKRGTVVRTLKHDQILGYESLQAEWDLGIFLTHVLPEDRPVIQDALNGGIHGDQLHLECRVMWPDGSIHWLDIEGFIYRDGDGVAISVLGVVMDITARKLNEERISQLNASLRDRATELESANSELESFSYSVSHDLRAPLRSISGFSQILLEDHAGQLTADGKDALARVRKAATTMSELIDALLALSGLSRREIRVERVDLSSLARSLVADLYQAQPDRRATFVIAPGLFASGDRVMLRVVLANFIDNAWKFTKGRELARIEFGSVEQGDETVYFVRDNGAGFDMAYAGKLFGAFQRLHPRTEFGGTGIGLATVKRIVHRHGGRVWAEAQEGQGATFYFTLRRQASSQTDTPGSPHDIVGAP